MKRWLLPFCPLILLTLSGCAGYTLNGSKPAKLAEVTKLYVPTFENETLEPRLSVLVTNTVIKQLQATGTYQIVKESEADATLKGTITTIDRSQWRAVRSNTLRTKELLARMKLNYRVVDSGGTTLQRGRVQATSYVPLDTNWQTSERQLLSETAERMSVTLAGELSNGW